MEEEENLNDDNPGSGGDGKEGLVVFIGSVECAEKLGSKIPSFILSLTVKVAEVE